MWFAERRANLATRKFIPKNCEQGSDGTRHYLEFGMGKLEEKNLHSVYEIRKSGNNFRFYALPLMSYVCALCLKRASIYPIKTNFLTHNLYSAMSDGLLYALRSMPFWSVSNRAYQ
jgi:hypothetical protein